MPMPSRTVATSAAIAVAVVTGGLATGAAASTAPPPYKVKTHDRILTIAARGSGGDLALRLAPGDPQTLDIDVGNDGSADFAVARSRFDSISIMAGTGDNRVVVDEADGAFTTDEPTTIDGQAGDDVLTGGSGGETLRGGDGDDFVDAGRGADLVATGAGDDTFVWDPGQGSDTFDGGTGSDLMLFNGAAGAEQFVVTANGSRVRFTRDPGGIVMDLDGVERVVTNTLAGADAVTVGDLTGTDTTVVGVNLGAVDGVADAVTVDGTFGDDAIRAGGTATRVTVAGASARVEISGAQLNEDKLAIFGLAGNDVIDASELTADAIQFAADGGAGDDILRGGDGDDKLDGGDGDDLLVGGPGLDGLVGGAGANVIVQD